MDTATHPLNRRTLVKGAAWTAPTILAAQQVSAAAASCPGGGAGAMRPSGAWYFGRDNYVINADQLDLTNVVTFYIEDLYLIIRNVPAGYWLQSLQLGFWQQQRVYSTDKSKTVANIRNWGWAAPLLTDPNTPQAWKSYASVSQPSTISGWSNFTMPSGNHSVENKIGYPQTPPTLGPTRAFQLVSTWNNPDPKIATTKTPWNLNNLRTIADPCDPTKSVTVQDTFTSIVGRNYANPPSTLYSSPRFSYRATGQPLTLDFADDSSKYGKTAYYGYRAVLKNQAGATITVSFSNNPHDLMPWRNSKVGATVAEAKADGIDYVFLFVDAAGRAVLQ